MAGAALPQAVVAALYSLVYCMNIVAGQTIMEGYWRVPTRNIPQTKIRNRWWLRKIQQTVNKQSNSTVNANGNATRYNWRQLGSASVQFLSMGDASPTCRLIKIH